MENNNNNGRSFFRRASDAGDTNDNQREERGNDDSSGDSSSSGRRPLDKKPYERRAMGSHDKKPYSGSGNRYGQKRGEDNRSPAARFYSKTDSRDSAKRGDNRGDRRGGSSYNNEQGAERSVPENVIFGIHPVREAIEAGTGIEKIYFRRAGDEFAHGGDDRARREDRWQRGDFRRETPRDNTVVNQGALDALREQAEEAGIHIQEVPAEKLNRLTRNGNHQGVVAVIAAIEYKEINELIEELSAKIEAGEAPLVMLMDSVTDIRNFGAMARSAECAGAEALIMPAKNSAPVNAEAIKSSAGALTLIPVSRVGSLKGTLSLLKGIGMLCVAATEKASTMIYDVDFTGPTVIVMGAEDKGISRDVLALCDAEAGIPLVGRIESLNVGAAAAIVLFEARRQRFGLK